MEKENKRMDTIFSFKRFQQVLWYDISTNRKQYLRVFLMTFVCWGIYFTMRMLLIHPYRFSDSARFSTETTAIATFSLFIGMVLYASRILSTYNEKGNRINLLMLPATALEKYIDRLLIVSIGMLVVFIAAFALTDLLRVGMLLMTGYKPEYAHLCFTSVLADWMNGNKSGLSLLLWLHSCYVLGGCYWHKHAVLFVSAVLWIGSFLFTWLFGFTPYSISIDEEVVFITLMLSLSVLNYCAGYSLFKRMTLLDFKLFRL